MPSPSGNPALRTGSRGGGWWGEITRSIGHVIPGAKEYFDKFKAAYQKDTEYHGAEAYAAAYVMADVLKRAKSMSPGDIKQAHNETDMQTAFGPVKFISYGKMTNQNKLNTYVVQWQNGKLQLIWPTDLAQVKYVYPVDWLKEWGF